MTSSTILANYQALEAAARVLCAKAQMIVRLTLWQHDLVAHDKTHGTEHYWAEWMVPLEGSHTLSHTLAPMPQAKKYMKVDPVNTINGSLRFDLVHHFIAPYDHHLVAIQEGTGMPLKTSRDVLTINDMNNGKPWQMRMTFEKSTLTKVVIEHVESDHVGMLAFLRQVAFQRKMCDLQTMHSFVIHVQPPDTVVVREKNFNVMRED